MTLIAEKISLYIRISCQNKLRILKLPHVFLKSESLRPKQFLSQLVVTEITHPLSLLVNHWHLTQNTSIRLFSSPHLVLLTHWVGFLLEKKSHTDRRGPPKSLWLLWDDKRRCAKAHNSTADRKIMSQCNCSGYFTVIASVILIPLFH